MCEPIIVPLTALEQSWALTCVSAQTAGANEMAGRADRRAATALMGRRSFYFDWAGQLAVDDAPPVVIDDPIMVPCTAALLQLASTLFEPSSLLFGEWK
jgi:hypothetical protein